MAIRFMRDWYTIIINVEKANKKIEGGLIALLSDYYPPKEKTMLEKIKSMFSSAKPLTLSDFDDMHFSSGREVFAENGCDGNLYFLSLIGRRQMVLSWTWSRQDLFQIRETAIVISTYMMILPKLPTHVSGCLSL